MKKLTLLVAMLAMVLVAAAPVMAQDLPVAEAKKEGKAVAAVDEDVKAKAEKGKAEAVAGDAKAKAECPPGPVVGQAGDVVAKADCPEPKKKEEKKEEKKEVKVEVKKEEKKEEKKELPKTGGTGSASLLALGAGALLVGGGLLARRFVR